MERFLIIEDENNVVVNLEKWEYNFPMLSFDYIYFRTAKVVTIKIWRKNRYNNNVEAIVNKMTVSFKPFDFINVPQYDELIIRELEYKCQMLSGIIEVMKLYKDAHQKIRKSYIDKMLLGGNNDET